jgi:two-component system, NarL family, response regulator NreC
MTESVRVLIAVTQRSLRQGARLLLAAEPEFEVVGEATNRRQALQLMESLRPDALILSLILPSRDVVEFVEQVRRLSPRTRVVSMQTQPQTTSLSLAMVADQIVQAVRDATLHHDSISVPLPAGDPVATQQSLRDTNSDAFRALTPREREVLIMTAGGMSSVETGRRLGISPRTAETHRARVMNKLGLHRRADLVRYVIARGILPPEPERTP